MAAPITDTYPEEFYDLFGTPLTKGQKIAVAFRAGNLAKMRVGLIEGFTTQNEWRSDHKRDPKTNTWIKLSDLGIDSKITPKLVVRWLKEGMIGHPWLPTEEITKMNADNYERIVVID